MSETVDVRTDRPIDRPIDRPAPRRRHVPASTAAVDAGWLLDREMLHRRLLVITKVAATVNAIFTLALATCVLLTVRYAPPRHTPGSDSRVLALHHWIVADLVLLVCFALSFLAATE